jgi:O-antigen/teichoic acid export membrane protein
VTISLDWLSHRRVAAPDRFSILGPHAFDPRATRFSVSSHAPDVSGPSPILPTRSDAVKHEALAVVDDAPVQAESAPAATVARGIAWQAGMRWSAQIVSWLSMVYIARILTPKDYGLVGLVMWFILFLSIITDFGIGTTVLSRRELVGKPIAQLNAVAIMMGLAAFAVTALLAPVLADFYREPQLNRVVVVLGLSFIFTALAVVPTAMLQRGLRYKELAMLDFARALGTTLTVVALATLKFGFWALVIGNLVGGCIFTVLAISLAPHSFAMPNWQVLRSPLAHGSFVLTNSLAYAVYTNSDFAIVGKVLGVTAAGYYGLAWTLATLPGEKITNVVQSVLRPLFASLQSDPRALRAYFLLSSQLLAAVLTPMFAGLALVAPDAIPVFLGAQWTPAVPAVQLLCVFAVGQNLAVVYSNVLLNRTEASRMALYAVLLACVLPPLFWFAASRYGLLAIPVTWCVVQPVIMLYPLRLATRLLNMRFREYFIGLRPVAVATTAMAVIVWLIGAALSDVAPLSRLAAEVVVGALVYVGVWHFVFRARRDTLLALVRGRKLAPGAM